MKRTFRMAMAVVFVGVMGLAAACTPGATATPGDLTALPEEPTLSPDALTLPVDTPVPPELSAPVVEHPQLTSFHMLNELDGWGITESAVVRTNDGGTTWHDVTPPGNPFLGYGASGSFLSAGRAILVAPDQSDPIRSGTLYTTQDGGESWTSQAIPFGASQLQFFDDMQNGWAMVSLGVGAGSNAIAIYTTTDSGKDWKQVFINDPTVEGTSNEIPLGGLKGVFVAQSMQRAWVGGVVYSNQTFYLYRTDDGGTHWQQVELTPPEGSQEAQLSVEGLQFVSAQDGFLTMQLTDSTGSYRAVYATHDAGDAWEMLPPHILNARATDFVSEMDGFMFDGLAFQVTHDGGQTWSATSPDIVFTDTFMSMDFVNGQTGWLTSLDPTTSKTILYKTTDSGATWIAQ
jgi:photosystem II stability/assembly factor-like uncharacterized protein